jgi:hypothetical protein
MRRAGTLSKNIKSTPIALRECGATLRWSPRSSGSKVQRTGSRLTTSSGSAFSRFRKKLTSPNWRRLHKARIYTLWFLPTFFFFDDFLQRRDLFDGAAVGVLLAVLVLRLAGRVRVTKPVSVAQTS